MNSMSDSNPLMSGRPEFEPPSYIEVDNQFTSAFYKDHNEEEYAIFRAFQSNNYNYIRDLPDNFAHQSVLNKRLDKARTQMDREKYERTKPYEMKLAEQAEAAAKKKLERIGTLGFFQLFPYKESPYGLAKEMAALDQVASTAKRNKISEVEFRPSDVQKKSKYEDPFKFVDKMSSQPRDNTDYLFPFNRAHDNYNHLREDLSRQRVVSEAARLAGPFLPSQQQITLGGIHRSRIEEILTEIQRCLKSELSRYAYIIGVNKKDHIEILFEGIHQKDLKLKAFMSGFCEHEIVSKYKLRRDLEHWGIMDNKYILFTAIPPWVRGYTVAISPEQTGMPKNTK